MTAHAAKALTQFPVAIRMAMQEALRADMDDGVKAMAGATDLMSMGRAQAQYRAAKQLLDACNNART